MNIINSPLFPKVNPKKSLGTKCPDKENSQPVSWERYGTMQYSFLISKGMFHWTWKTVGH